MTTTERVLIVLKPNIFEELREFLPQLVSMLENEGITPLFFNYEKERMVSIFKKTPPTVCFIDKNKITEHISLVICLGGDGTLIGFCRDIKYFDLPIFGINLGKLGFLTEFSKDGYRSELLNVLHKKYSYYPMNLYRIHITDSNQKTYDGIFINDVVVCKSNISRIINLRISTQAERIFDVAGDGIIVSSPLGSTAYSLSAGGPIIHPSVNALVLTPICPHTLNSRPLVLPDHFQIYLSLEETIEDVSLTIDGQQVMKIDRKCMITVQKQTNMSIKIIQNPERTYFNNLNDKFLQGKRL